MSQTGPLIDTLKQELRKQRITYKSVARALELSETSVKRLFSEESFSVRRLEKVCELLQLELGDLVRLMESNIELTARLTLEQEQELAADARLLLIALLLLNRLQFSDIVAIYEISAADGMRLLERLEAMKLVALHPRHRVELMVASDFSWIPKGPVQKFLETRVHPQFLMDSFDRPDELRVFSTAMLSPAAHAEILGKVQQLAQEMKEMNIESQKLPLAQRFGSSLMMAIRPCEIEAFKDLRRGAGEREHG